MKRFLCVIAGMMAVVAPAVVHPQMMSSGMYGAGPHGYDWAIGKWSCTNTMPSPMGGPTHTTLTVSKANNGAIFYRSTGTNFDNVWYNVYVPAKKMWTSPFILADGSYGTESTSQTGKKIVWVGTATFGDSGKMMPIRDTNSISPNNYADLGEYRSGGVWKAQYNVSCART
jgi:hypothetical protein